MREDADSSAVYADYSIEDVDEPLLTIVEAVADVKGVDTLELQPLQSVINIDSLNTFMSEVSGDFYRSSSDDSTREPLVTFEYEGCEVTVKGRHVRVIAV